MAWIKPGAGRLDAIELLGSQEFIEKVRNADLIVGRNEWTSSPFILFGGSTEIRSESQTLSVHIAETTELELLLNVILQTKGPQAYNDARAAAEAKEIVDGDSGLDEGED